jgi:hypothetical protein
MRTHLAPKAGRAIGSARLTSALWRAARDSGSVHVLRWGPSSQTGVMRTRRVPPSLAGSALAGFCFPAQVIVLSVRWYLRFALSTAMSRSSSPSGVSRWTT